MKDAFWFRMLDDISALMALKPAQLRAYLVVGRAIQKDRAAGRISASQVAKLLGIHRQHAQLALDHFVSVEMLLREGRPGAVPMYRLPFAWKGANLSRTADKASGANLAPRADRSTGNGDGILSPTDGSHLSSRTDRNLPPTADTHIEIPESSEATHHQRIDDAAVSDYELEIQNILGARRCWRSRALSASDREIASRWQSEGITIATVKAAIVTGCARKEVSATNRGGDPRINSLAYSDPILGEEISQDQVAHLERRLKQMETCPGAPTAVAS